jgi:DNA-binding MarR family transcriptional regulator
MDETNHPYCRCLFYSANALARNITRVAEEAFSRTGLAPSLAFALMTVRSNPGIQPSEVARIMMLSPSTLTRLVEKLEIKGLLRREAQGKTIRLNLTDQGEALGPALLDAWQDTLKRYTAILGEGPAKDLTEHTYAAAVALDAS